MDTSTTLDGTTGNVNEDLSDVIDNLFKVLTMRAGNEFDQWGLQTGINYSSFYGTASSLLWGTLDRFRISRLTGNEVSEASS